MAKKNYAYICQIRSNIRCAPELPYEEIIKVFKGERVLTDDLLWYFIGFFDECSLRLIKSFMEERDISREQILNVFNSLPDIGETYAFREAIKNGEF